MVEETEPLADVQPDVADAMHVTPTEAARILGLKWGWSVLDLMTNGQLGYHHMPDGVIRTTLDALRAYQGRVTARAADVNHPVWWHAQQEREQRRAYELDNPLYGPPAPPTLQDYQKARKQQARHILQSLGARVVAHIALSPAKCAYLLDEWLPAYQDDMAAPDVLFLLDTLVAWHTEDEPPEPGEPLAPDLTDVAESLNVLQLPQKAYYGLRRHGIDTIGSLASLSATQILDFRNVGQKSLDAMYRALAAYREGMAATDSRVE